MKWKKNILTILSFFLISSLILVSFGYAINTTSNDIDPHSNGLADSPWPRWRGNNQGTGLSPYNTSFVDGTEKWNITIDGSIKSQPVIGPDGTIYICSNNTIHAIENKKEIWNVSLAADIRPKSTPAIAKDGTLYITTMNNNLTAINSDGEVKWSYHNRYNSYFQTTPVIGYDGTIYVTDCQGVFAFAPNGTLKWDEGRMPMDVPKMGNSPVIGYDENIYFGSEDYNLGPIFYSINKSGELNWDYYGISNNYEEENDDISSSSAVAKDGTIYFGSADGLYAMRSDGKVKWTFQPTDNVMLISPAIDMDGNIYTGDLEGNLYSVSPDGEKRWNYTVNTDTFSSPVISSDGRIYFADDNSTLHALNNDGEEIWNFSTDHDLGGFSPAINSDGTLYYATGNKLHAIGPSSPIVNITSPKKKEIYNDSVTVGWEGSTVGTDIEHYEVKIDEKSWIDIGKDSSYKFEDMKEGKHVFKVKAVAESGNYDIDSIEITVFTPPELNILAPKEDEIFNTSSVTVEWTSNDESGINHHEVQLNGEDWNDVGIDSGYTFKEISDGKHTVRVKAVDNTGNSTVKSVNFTVDITPPTADAGENIEVGISEQFTLDGSGSTDNIGIGSYRWVINGETYNKKVVNLSIDEIGEYTAELTVTDTAGNTDTDSIIVTVMDKTGPEADAGEDQTVAIGETVNFDGSGSYDNVEIVSFEWDFGDGSTGTGETTTHMYDSPGMYTVTLTVTDEAGYSDSDSITVTVNDETDPVADAGEDRTVKVDEEVTFDASGSSDNLGITSYEWDFDDGTTATGEKVDHKFDEKGTYEVKLTVTDEAGNTDTDTVTITVEKKDDNGAPGFTWCLLSIGILIAVLIYSKKEG